MIVVDASVAVKWFVAEEGADAAEAIAVGAGRLIGPSLLLLEVARALQKSEPLGDLAAPSPEVALEALRRIVTEFVGIEPLIGPALALAREIGHPIYDCVYLALAVQRGTLVVTADDKFHRKVRDTPHARHLAHLAVYAP